MQPTEQMTDLDRLPEQDSGRRAIRVIIGVIIGGFILIALVLIGLGSLLPRSSAGKPIKSEGEAVAIVTGLTRPSDGVTFGEFARVRYGGEISCSGWDPAAIGFSASEPLGSRQSSWVVYTQYRGEAPRACQFNEIGAPRAVATVDGVTREVVPLANDFSWGSDARPEWLIDFREGNPANAPPPSPAIAYPDSTQPVTVTMRLGERIRIPFGPVHATGRAIEFHGVTYSGPGLGPADFGMIRHADAKDLPRVETGDPQPYKEQVGIERREMRPDEKWVVLVTGKPEPRQTIRLTEVSFHWSPAGSLELEQTSFPIDITIVVE